MFNIKKIILLSALAINGTAWADLNTGLVAHYPLDEAVGATVAHDSAGSVDGIVEGGTTFAPGMGVLGGAARFDPATGDYITMGDNFGFTNTSFSIQAWVKLDLGDTGGMPVIKHKAGIAAGYFLAINDVGDGCSEISKAHFYVAYPCSGVSTVEVNDGTWHQVIGVYDQTTQVSSVYVDGQFQAASSGGNVSIPTDAPFAIAGIMDGLNTSILSTYKGWVDEVRVYNRTLNPTEIQDLYLQTPQKPFASFVPSLSLTMKPGAKDDTFKLTGTFGLDVASDGVNPAKEIVALQVGDYTTTIPVGAFKLKFGKYVYTKILPEITLSITITPSGGANYSFIATAKATDLTRKAIPIEVGLSIGNEGTRATLFTNSLTARP